MTTVVATARRLLGQCGTSLLGLLVLARTGIVMPVRPDRLYQMARALRRWSLTLPGGYAVGAHRHPDAPAIIDELGTLTWAEVDTRSTRLAHGLAGLGLVTGDKLAVLCRNHRGLVESMVAAGKLGVHLVLLNTGASAAQIGAVLKEEGISLVVADAEFRPLLAKAPRGVRRVTAWPDEKTRSETIESLIESSPATELPVPSAHGRVIVLTSGTTGTPKGARRPEVHGLFSAATLLSRIPLRYGQRLLVAAPMFHTWGLAALQLGLLLGCPLVLQRRFDPESTVEALEKEQCAVLFAVPVMLQRILELPPEVLRKYHPAQLKIVASSGSALPGALAVEFQRQFGPVLYNLYGSTEVSWVSVATPAELTSAPATAGKPPLGTRLAILDESGDPVPQGGTGRIFVANGLLFDGYTNGKSKEVRDGMMCTGDVGYLDPAGRLFVAGRDDDMIVSGGENVYPREVEDLLARQPQVREAAVLGVPDREFGQRLAAYVVLDEQAELDADAVRELVKANLARHCVPRDVVFLEALPRNATGKVLKRELPRPS
ncbi:AMP-binding protein [Crossiella sp. CA-258035]|uniref:AMP-binding protein n=1 Tax=Crossiella sp. CA-258035 TaxID=2981138 RepID=UPI0024BD0904|nr:AMP-binding protein [Crossiella sp. CA-258035]WHT20681.1 AMP-binding protein [Crossiella sp. CA-258035]